MMQLVQTCSLQLTQRQRLEENLYQELKIVQKPRLRLELYRDRQNFLTRLYAQALKKNRVFKYQKHGMEFEYALISRQAVPAEIWQNAGLAFSHCLINKWDKIILGRKVALARGSWLLFVIEDYFPEKKLPAKVIEYLAVHEYGEMATLGDHNLASKLEFAIAAQEKKLSWYMYWIEKYYPSKFAEIFSYQIHLVVPETDQWEEVSQLFTTSAAVNHVLDLINNFNWPVDLLHYLNKHRIVNQKVLALVINSLDQAKLQARQAGLPFAQIIMLVETEIRVGLEVVVINKWLKYINPDMIQEIWQQKRAELDLVFAKTRELRRGYFKNSNDFADELLSATSKGELPKDGYFSFSFADVYQKLKKLEVKQ